MAGMWVRGRPRSRRQVSCASTAVLTPAITTTAQKLHCFLRDPNHSALRWYFNISNAAEPKEEQSRFSEPGTVHQNPLLAAQGCGSRSSSKRELFWWP